MKEIFENLISSIFPIFIHSIHGATIISLYSKKSSRLRYIFDLMLQNLLGLEITFTDKADVFSSH
ncbi:MAG: hypothetical protein IPO63_10070 [Bacteroidetes bacterium]|nr:hypothetical protein [Bacteroidota bacterium]